MLHKYHGLQCVDVVHQGVLEGVEGRGVMGGGGEGGKESHKTTMCVLREGGELERKVTEKVCAHMTSGIPGEGR